MNHANGVLQFLSDHSAQALTVVAIAATAASTLIAALVSGWRERVRRQREEATELASLEVMSANWDDAKTDAILEIAFANQTETASHAERLNARDGAHNAGAKAPTDIARRQVALRIAEAASTRNEQLRSAKWFNVAANGLIWTNFILGGVLASSFVQASVSPRWAGGLGVLVLIASLVQQKYHPDIDADVAAQKTAQLLTLIRVSEDKLAVADTKIAAGEDQTKAMIELMQWLTQRLGEIDSLRVAQPSPGGGNQGNSARS